MRTILFLSSAAIVVCCTSVDAQVVIRDTIHVNAQGLNSGDRRVISYEGYQRLREERHSLNNFRSPQRGENGMLAPNRLEAPGNSATPLVSGSNASEFVVTQTGNLFLIYEQAWSDGSPFDPGAQLTLMSNNGAVWSDSPLIRLPNPISFGWRDCAGGQATFSYNERERWHSDYHGTNAYKDTYVFNLPCSAAAASSRGCTTTNYGGLLVLQLGVGLYNDQPIEGGYSKIEAASRLLLSADLGGISGPYDIDGRTYGATYYALHAGYRTPVTISAIAEVWNEEAVTWENMPMMGKPDHTARIGRILVHGYRNR